MRRRSRLAITIVSLVLVSLNVVFTTPRDPALAANPSLADAQQQQQQLREQIVAQRAQLDELEAQSATLGTQLDAAEAELGQVTAEYDRVHGLWVQAQAQIEEIRAQLAELLTQISALDRQLTDLGAQIARNQADLAAREALLQQHLRDAYEQSRTSLLEVLLASDNLDDASTQVGYLLTVSETDTRLADEIRDLRDQLTTRQKSMKEGRAALEEARVAAEEQQTLLEQREAELAAMTQRLAELKAAADDKRRQQEAALNATLASEADQAAALEQSIAQQQAADSLVQKLQADEAARQAALEEARRRAAVEAEARRQREAAAAEAAKRAADQEAAERAAAEQARQNAVSASGFRWPEAGTHATQEFGPTSFVLEPPYSSGGVSYAHYHTGLDMAAGCGTPILAAGTGVVAASGQPLFPFDSGFGVILDHGNGLQTWYWHLQARVTVSPGQPITIGQVIGYEGSTGNSTGCHLHFAVNQSGVWSNPRFFLP